MEELTEEEAQIETSNSSTAAAEADPQFFFSEPHV